MKITKKELHTILEALFWEQVFCADQEDAKAFKAMHDKIQDAKWDADAKNKNRLVLSIEL